MKNFIAGCLLVLCSITFASNYTIEPTINPVVDEMVKALFKSVGIDPVECPLEFVQDANDQRGLRCGYFEGGSQESTAWDINDKLKRLEDISEVHVEAPYIDDGRIKQTIYYVNGGKTDFVIIPSFEYIQVYDYPPE